MKFLLFFAVFVFALLGLSEFLHILKIKFILSKSKPNVRVFVNLKEETALKQLAFVVEQHLWLGSHYANEVIAVASNLSDETFSECERIAKLHNIKIYCERKGKNGSNIRYYRKNNLSQ